MATIESLATKAMISAQETMPGHSASTRLFTLSTKSKPLSDRFGKASFSAWLFEVEFRSTDASHPWIKPNMNFYVYDCQVEKVDVKRRVEFDTNPDKAVMEVHS